MNFHPETRYRSQETRYRSPVTSTEAILKVQKPSEKVQKPSEKVQKLRWMNGSQIYQPRDQVPFLKFSEKSLL